MAKDLCDTLIYALYPKTGIEFLKWKYGLEPVPERVKPKTLEDVKREDEAMAKGEKFDRSKILNGLLKACEKRPVSLNQLERIVDRIELRVQESPERELESATIGRMLLSELRKLDKVA